MFSLEGKTALVTGSSKGLGRAIAFGLGRAGAQVCVNYYNGREVAEQVVEDMKSEGIKCALVQADVSVSGDVDRLVALTEKALGPVDILVPNATPAQPQMPIEEYTWQHYQTMLDFFVKSPYLLARAVLPGMKARKYGRIINIGSEVVACSVPNFSAYVAAKGAQAGWTRSMASELAPWRITVNIICPGWIPVERHENDPAEMKEGYRKTIPLGRWGVPDDVASAAVYLASDEAAFQTGQSIYINGGRVHGW